MEERTRKQALQAQVMAPGTTVDDGVAEAPMMSYRGSKGKVHQMPTQGKDGRRTVK